MKVTSIARFHNEASPNSSVSRDAISLLDNPSEHPAWLVTPREDEQAVHQDLRNQVVSIDAQGSQPDSGRTLSAICVDDEPSASLQIMQNDLVALAGEWGTWQVVALVNGSKADLRRTEGFDTRVVTAVLKNLTLIRCAGSPGCSY